ncbi:MAG: hypothetical protein N3D73_01360 [Candidatus Diapherotrites archaeon]|nr:hypothetical protein [Candidatus Diapherotrites archaeon]
MRKAFIFTVDAILACMALVVLYLFVSDVAIPYYELKDSSYGIDFAIANLCLGNDLDKSSYGISDSLSGNSVCYVVVRYNENNAKNPIIANYCTK